MAPDLIHYVMRIHYISLERILSNRSLYSQKRGIETAIILSSAIAATAATGTAVASSATQAAMTEDTIDFQKEENEVARQYNAKQAELARTHQTQERIDAFAQQTAFTKEMMNEVNKYNSPVNQLGLLRDAGVSPYEMKGQSFQSMTPSTPSPSGVAGPSATTSPTDVLTPMMNLARVKGETIQKIGDKFGDIVQSMPMLREQYKGLKEDVKSKELANKEQELKIKYDKGLRSAYRYMLTIPPNRSFDENAQSEIINWNPYQTVGERYGEGFDPSQWLNDKYQPLKGINDPYLKDSTNKLFPLDYDEKAFIEARSNMINFMQNSSKAISDMSYNDFQRKLNQYQSKLADKKGNAYLNVLTGINEQTFKKLQSEVKRLDIENEFWSQQDVKEGRVSMYKDQVRISEITRKFKEDTDLRSLIEKIKDPDLDWEDKVLSMLVGFVAFATK